MTEINKIGTVYVFDKNNEILGVGHNIDNSFLERSDFLKLYNTEARLIFPYDNIGGMHKTENPLVFFNNLRELSKLKPDEIKRVKVHLKNGGIEDIPFSPLISRYEDWVIVFSYDRNEVFKELIFKSSQVKMIEEFILDEKTCPFKDKFKYLTNENIIVEAIKDYEALIAETSDHYKDFKEFMIIRLMKKFISPVEFASAFQIFNYELEDRYIKDIISLVQALIDDISEKADKKEESETLSPLNTEFDEEELDIDELPEDLKKEIEEAIKAEENEDFEEVNDKKIEDAELVN